VEWGKKNLAAIETQATAFKARMKTTLQGYRTTECTDVASVVVVGLFLYVTMPFLIVALLLMTEAWKHYSLPQKAIWVAVGLLFWPVASLIWWWFVAPLLCVIFGVVMVSGFVGARFAIKQLD